MRIKIHPHDWTPVDLEKAGAAMAQARRQPEAGFWTQALNADMWAGVRARHADLMGQAARFVVCGVGGSSLGAKALTSLNHDRSLFYLDNLDPESVRVFRDRLGGLEDVHWLWISKSGGTLETLTHLQLAAGWCKDSGIQISKKSTVIAEPRASALTSWAKDNDVPTLEIPGHVSGRFSVLTAAGLLPAALSGLDLTEIEKGVRAVSPTGDGEVDRLIAAALKSWQRGEWITAIWTYCDQLRPFAHWLQQLWAESLGKAVTRDGSTAPRTSFPLPCIGSLDQHSLLQQFIEGHKSHWIWILRVDENESAGEKIREVVTSATPWLKNRSLGEIFAAQAEGTAQALAAAQVSTLQWHWPKLDAFHIGKALFMMELMVAGLGEALGINTYNQPGVERGKVITLDLLK